MSTREEESRQNIPAGIVKAIAMLGKKHKFEDFEVIIEGESIKCHSFLLASCSEFFYNLLDSNMKEKQEMKVNLQNISLKSFKLILDTLYTGSELLTKDNVLEIWATVHELQIEFLIQHCEDFVVDNVTLETMRVYKRQADILHCQSFSDRVFPFMLDNFMSLKKTESFYELDLKEMTKLIESDQLVVSSEDHALYSIYDWVSHGEKTAPNVQEGDEIATVNNLATLAKVDVAEACSDIISLVIDKELETKDEEASIGLRNERALYLHQLLNSSRYLLASEACIKNLLMNKLTQDNAKVKRLLSQAKEYKRRSNLSGFWPDAAIHRDCSHMEHVGVNCGSIFEAYSFKRQKWFFVLSGGDLSYGALVVNLNGQLYGYKTGEKGNELDHYSNDKWVRVLTLNNNVLQLLAHDNCIYMLNDNMTLTKCQPNNQTTISEPYSPETDIFQHSIINAKYAMSFHSNILVFESVGNNNSAKTAVHSWHVQNNDWTYVTELEFSADKMTSFNDDHFYYILDKAGFLYRVEEAESVHFSFIEQIWDFRVALNGAVLFKKALYVCGEQRGEGYYVTKVEKIYSSLKFLNNRCSGRNFIPLLFEKSELTSWP
ncbi:uncharacterized protein LOC106050448 [Biomphalaria glabrata]|uniref:Uncharacterized protein LOC106050448 n=1 Tax=Biomphalaria glabrata TaxID=6526 RepID=A0A9U8DTS8_BIOGL|nr:uncharacterized protein LOC106050448 [Biomphalaria glabrata]XP_013060867.2 uncharacterized protein LOC106050448 [Biomphalaria glabrata]